MALRARPGAGLRRATRRGPVALLLALYGFAAAAATWPAVDSFRSSFIADGTAGFGEPAAGDHLQTVYRFWLVGHQLEGGDAPWRDPYSFQPLVEPQLALGGWPFGLPFWPLDAIFGPVVAWNTLLLAGVVAAGLLTYAWLRALSLPPFPSTLGGLAFAIAPYRIEQSGGHLLGWIAIFLPLALLAVERARTAASPRTAHAWGALAALALVSIPLSGQVHLTLGAVPFVVAYAIVRGFSHHPTPRPVGRDPASHHPTPRPVGRDPTRRLLLAWVLGGAVAAIGIGLAIRYTVIAGSIEAGGRSLDEVELFQADWLDLLRRGTPRPGDTFASERFVFVGWLTPVLAVAGLGVLVRRRRFALAAVLGLGALVPIILALGTNVPTYSLLWDVLPPFRFPRVPQRLMPIADLALAGLVAAAVARALAGMTARRTAALAAALAVLIGADLTVQPLEASSADPENEAYAALPSVGRLLELPLFEPGIHFGSVYNYYALRAPHERPGGYSTLAPTVAFDYFFRLNRLSCGVWLPGDEPELRSLGVDRVLFHRGLYRQAQLRGAWFGWKGLLEHGFRPRVRDGEVTLLAQGPGPGAPAPVPEPPRTELVFCEGWRGWTMNERQAPFWIYGRGRLELELRAPGTTQARLWVDGRFVRWFPVARTGSVSVELPARSWHAVTLEVPRLFETKPPQGLRVARLTLP